MVLALWWTLVFVGALAGGITFVGLLALKRFTEALMAILSLLGVAISVWATTEVVDHVGRPEVIVIAVVFGGASFVGGFGLGSALLQNLWKHAHRIALPDHRPVKPESVSVLLFAPVEPEYYEPAAVAAEFEELASSGMPEATIGIMPFLFAAEKARYRALGGRSPSPGQARELAERIERLLLPDSRFANVQLVTDLGSDTLDQAVKHHAEHDTDHIIVAPVTIGESYALDRAKSAVGSLHPEQHGLEVTYTPTLWGCEDLAKLVADQVRSSACEPEHTGVALVMHGQPETRERTHNTYDVEENAFCNRVRMLLADGGIPEQRIRLCFLEWREPDVTETVRHLAALGSRRVLVIPACFPFDTVTTRLDLAVAIKQARVEDHVDTITVGVWGTQPETARILAEWITDASRCVVEKD